MVQSKKMEAAEQEESKIKHPSKVEGLEAHCMVASANPGWKAEESGDQNPQGLIKTGTLSSGNRISFTFFAEYGECKRQGAGSWHWEAQGRQAAKHIFCENLRKGIKWGEKSVEKCGRREERIR